VKKCSKCNDSYPVTWTEENLSKNLFYNGKMIRRHK